MAFFNKFFLVISLLIFSSTNWAKNETAINLDYLVTPELSSPFDIPLDTLREQNRALELRIQQAMAEITVLEKELFENKKFLEQHGYSAEGFMAEFHRRSELLSSDEKELLDKGEDIPFELSNSRSVEFRSLYNLVNVGVHLGGEFIDQFEDYDQKSQDLEIAVGLKLLRQEIEFLRSSPVEGRRLELLKKSYDEIIKYKNDYVENKNQYGQAKDIYRVTPFNKFIAKVRATITDIHHYDKLGTKSISKVFVEAILKQVKKLGMSMLPLAARFAQNHILNHQPDEKSVPITAVINRGVRLLGAIKGERVSVVGKENLPPLDDPNTVNIIFPNHGDASIDMHGIAKLKLDNAILFMAAGNFLPDKIAPGLIQALNNNKGVVVVGNRNNPNPIDPIDKLMDIIGTTGSRSVILFPQGMRPARDNAASPVREGPFQLNGPIRRLQRIRKVNIIPITMDYFTPYGLNGGNSDPTIVVRIHPMIPDKVRRRFMSLGGVKAMPILLQYGLFENLRTSKLPSGEIDPHGNVFWGKVRASQLDLILTNYLKATPRVISGPSCLSFYASYAR
ncbi:MAG: hypothetical protein J0M15_05935 [Deltaproteobacteria bacterium]|nr:hypothetical protein [Deltaproteobacteria bacterium]